MRWKLPATLLPVLVLVSSAIWSADLSLVRSLVEEGRVREALSEVEQHLAEHPVDPEAMFLRGFVLAEVRREKEAGEVFEELSGLRPDRPEPLNNLAVIQAAMGDYDEAVETLKQALRTHPAYRTAYENLTKIYGQLASEAYSRALSVSGSQNRASLELVLLSEMVLKAPAPVRLAEAPRPPRPSSADAMPSAAAVSIPAPLPSESANITKTSATTPDEAIEAAVEKGREIDSKSVEAAQSPMPTTPPVPSTPPPASETAGPAALAALVEAWATAWSEQRVEDYLAFYSSSFQPASDLDLEEWQQQRRARLAAPEFVKVSVAFLDFENTDPDRALVRFNQSYESDTFSDVVTKTLELVRQAGAWKIVREFVDS